MVRKGLLILLDPVFVDYFKTGKPWVLPTVCYCSGGELRERGLGYGVHATLWMCTSER